MAQSPAAIRPPTPARAVAPASDSVLARARGGDRDALEMLLGDHSRAIFTVCVHLCGAQDARDALQESLERIVRSLDRFEPAKGGFRPWAFSVARNVCRDRLRRRNLERATFRDDGGEEALIAPSPAADPERLAIARADQRSLEAALATLPENLRAALVLFHFQEASYEQIAATLEVPIGTVMTWIHRGRRRLRDAMEQAQVRTTRSNS
ncbi:MAG: RNA polymerase sigma factor [Deltaproteobacteria bacterium]|nr:RNA polymerase sigma factor [Deltaproteobacteria bacterium]